MPPYSAVRLTQPSQQAAQQEAGAIFNASPFLRPDVPFSPSLRRGPLVMSPRIEALKLPRSGLTETMRSLGATSTPGSHRPPESHRPTREFNLVTPLPSDPSVKGFLSKAELVGMRSWRTCGIASSPYNPPGAVRSELQQILGSSGSGGHKTSAIFGCSPPSRAINPLSKDATFTGSRRSGEHSVLSVLYPPSSTSSNTASCT